MNFFPLGHPHCKFVTPYISENIRARKKFYTYLDTAKYSFQAWTFFRWGRAGAVPPAKIWDLSHVSETTKASNLKCHTFRYSQVHFSEMNFFPLGSAGVHHNLV